MPYSELRKGRYSEPNREYFITTVIARRRPFLLDLWNVRLLVDALKATETQDDGQWLAWVAMPDHFHGLLRLGENTCLSRIMQRFKGRSAHAINRRLGLPGPFWRPAYHDHALRCEEDRRAIARYIVAPFCKGLVTKLGDFPHWDSIRL